MMTSGVLALRGGETGLAVEGAFDCVAEGGQFFFEKLVKGDIVVDQEQARLSIARSGELADAVEEAVAIDWLDEIVVGAEGDAEVALVDTGDDDDRDVARCGIALQKS